MGTRQELGLAILCILMALSAWLRQAGPDDVREIPRPCRTPTLVQSELGPRLGCGAGGALSAEARLVIGLKLDVNRADLKQLQLVPGIGPARAQKILELRREKRGFRDLNELREVRGIGEKTLLKLRPWLQLGRPR